jgi:hypothetical protein
MPQRLELDIPADTRMLRAARLATLDAATRAGLACDESEDLCLALDELCFALINATSPGDRIHLEIQVLDGVRIDGWAPAATYPGFALSDFGALLVDLAVDDHLLEIDHDALHFVLTQKASSVMGSR